MQRNNHSDCQGRLFVVGIGPGSPLDRTHRAEQAIRSSDVVVGYKGYLEKIPDLTKEIVSSGMRQEVARVEQAVNLALEGKTVSLVSSGDAGIYGMAGLALEIIHAVKAAITVDIIPGITAASAAAAKLGAPLMLDFAAISLSDLLVPWEEIRERLEALAPLDMVVCLYNPKSKKRIHQIEEAAELFRAHRPLQTPVGICRAMGDDLERTILTDLENFLEEEIDMKSIVIIGARRTKSIGPYMVTARGYKL